MQFGVWWYEFPYPQELHRVHQRLGRGLHIGLYVLVLIKVIMAFGVGSEIADVGADVGFVSRCDQANVFEPIRQYAAQRFNACRIAMHDNGESSPGEMARIVPAFQFKGFRLRRVLAAGSGGVGLPPSAQTRRSIIAFRPAGA
jgi:hypothetical protein